MHTTAILQFLKKHGQHLDSEIASATAIPMQDKAQEKLVTLCSDGL